MDKKTILAQRAYLVTAVRDFARGQVAEWRKVPHLALEADGRTGFNDNHSRAYRQGVWAVLSSVRDRSYAVYVDLATGELIDAYDFHRNGCCTPAQDADVLRLASNIDELEAAALVASLRAQARQKYPSYYKPAEQDAWREATRRETGVTPVYDATCRKPAPESFDDLVGD
jgi:hypothetical protein